MIRTVLTPEVHETSSKTGSGINILYLLTGPIKRKPEEETENAIWWQRQKRTSHQTTAGSSYHCHRIAFSVPSSGFRLIVLGRPSVVVIHERYWYDNYIYGVRRLVGERSSETWRQL